MKQLVTVLLSLSLLFALGCGEKQTEKKATETEILKKEAEMEPAGQVHAAHILIMYKEAMRAPAHVTLTKEEAKAKAEDLLKQINAGEDFAKLAKLNSDCPSSARGGDLGTFARGQMVKPFEDCAFSLEKGAVSEVIETDFGFHIIKRL